MVANLVVTRVQSTSQAPHRAVQAPVVVQHLSRMDPVGQPADVIPQTSPAMIVLQFVCRVQLEDVAVHASLWQTRSVHVQTWLPSAAQPDCDEFMHAPQFDTVVVPHDTPFVARVHACESL